MLLSKFSAQIKKSGEMPNSKSLYAKDLHIYFTNSEQLKSIVNTKNFMNKLKSAKTNSEYTNVQKKIKEFHKNLKQISYYRYIGNKESIETMPNFKKELDKFKSSSISRNLSKIVAQIIIKIYGIDNIIELLPKILLLCKYLSNKTGYYKKELQILQNAYNKKNMENVPDVTEIEQQISNKLVSQSAIDYFTIDKKWLLPLFKGKLNAFINKSQRNQDIKDLLHIMNESYPMINSAVCLLVYCRKNSSYSSYLPTFIRKSIITNNSNTSGNFQVTPNLFPRLFFNASGVIGINPYSLP